MYHFTVIIYWYLLQQSHIHTSNMNKFFYCEISVKNYLITNILIVHHLQQMLVYSSHTSSSSVSSGPIASSSHGWNWNLNGYSSVNVANYFLQPSLNSFWENTLLVHSQSQILSLWVCAGFFLLAGARVSLIV